MTDQNHFLQSTEEIRFATVQQVFDDGLTLLFPGESEAGEKRYRCNSFAVFSPGDRVCLAKDSGTYVVLFPVGDPKKSFRADSAKSASSADSAEEAKRAQSADFADQLTYSRTISLTGDVTASGNFSGAGNLSMTATGVKSGKVKDQNNPSGRYIEFRVNSAGVLQFRSSYYSNSYWYNMDGTRA